MQAHAARLKQSHPSTCWTPTAGKMQSAGRRKVLAPLNGGHENNINPALTQKVARSYPKVKDYNKTVLR